MQTPIVDMLLRHADASGVRFHMPGHKGRKAFLPEEALRFDITELPGTDNLLMPTGVISRSQRLNNQVFAARSCFYLVNGSTTGVIASVLGVTEPGDKVIFARDFHVSAVNAIALAGLKPVFVYPSLGAGGQQGVVTVNDIKQAIAENEDAKAIFLTYPNYYGLCFDIEEITKLAHRVGMYVVVDAAHSAAFAYSDLLPMHCGEAGADIWTMSLHKTLRTPNQCAVLCVGETSGADDEQVKRCINMLQTTSPSYLLLASCDWSLALMREEGARILRQEVLLTEEYIGRINNLGGYRCVSADIPRQSGAVDRDISRLVIDVTDRGMSGFSAAYKLQKFGVYVEAADNRNILLICSSSQREDYDRLLHSLANITGTNYNIAYEQSSAGFVEEAQVKYNMRRIMLGNSITLPFFKAEGQISAVAAGAYPPGVPLLLPGQEIKSGHIEQISRLQTQGYSLFGVHDGMIPVADM